MSDLTEEELEMVAELQTSDPAEVAAALRQLRADASRARAADLKRDADEFSAQNADVLDDPVLANKVEEYEQLLLRKAPSLTPQQRWHRALAHVRRTYGNANSRTIREMARVRSLGTRGMPNPNQVLDDDDERMTAETMVDEDIASDRLDAIAKIRIGRMGRAVEADPDYGRREVRRQREAHVSERQRAERDLSQE